MVRPPLLGLVCAFVSGCADAPSESAPWSFVPPADPPAATLDPAAFSAAVDRWLPTLTAVDPRQLTPALDAMAAACGLEASIDTDGWTRFWFGTSCGVDGGLDGFAYEIVSGGTAYTLWSAEAWSGDLHLWGNATWAVQDQVLEDGSEVSYSWFDGTLHTDDASRPTWFVGESSPNAGFARSVYPDGTVDLWLEGSTGVSDPDIDALHVTALTIDGGCTSASGIVSVRAVGGGWYDLTVTGVDGPCTACGDLTDAVGAAAGSACFDVQPLLDLGGVP